MRTLHLRIFVTFSLALLCTAAAMLWFSASISRRTIGDFFEASMKLQFLQAGRAYESGGPSALAAYLLEVDSAMNGQRYLTDASGRDLATGEDRSALRRIEFNWLGFPVARDGHFTFVMSSADGRYRFVTIAPPPISLAILFPYFLIAVLLVALLGVWLSVSIVSPLQKLANAVDRFGLGDLSVRAHDSRGGEIGMVAQSFNAMAERIATLLTALQEAEKRASQNEAISRTLLEQSQEMIVLSYFDRSQRYVSPGVQQIIGLTPDEYLATPVRELVHPEDLAAMTQAVQDVAHVTSSSVYRGRILHKDGAYRWVETLLRSCVDPESKQAVGYVATIRDIGKQKRREDLLASEIGRLSEEASQDALTGIANRRVFDKALVREVRRQTRNTRSMALLMLDVDNFKQYNDHYGHLPGDQCLKQVAATLERILQRDSDLVARFGGEEFVILLPLTDCEGAEHVARTILEAVRALAIPHVHSSRGILTVSIGVACWPSGSPTDSKRLLQQADTALYRAKSTGRDTFSVIHCEAEPPA